MMTLVERRGCQSQNERYICVPVEYEKQYALSEKPYPPYQKNRSIICLVGPYLVEYGPQGTVYGLYFPC